MRICLLAFFSFLVIASCRQEPAPLQKTGADGDPDSLPVVTLGSGGGFTGLWTGYEIRRDGSVFTWSGEDPDSSAKTFLKKISPAEVGSLDSLLTETLPVMSDPGNFSYLIRQRRQPPVIWNQASEEGQKLTGFYESLISRIENNYDTLD